MFTQHQEQEFGPGPPPVASRAQIPDPKSQSRHKTWRQRRLNKRSPQSPRTTTPSQQQPGSLRLITSNQAQESLLQDTTASSYHQATRSISDRLPPAIDLSHQQPHDSTTSDHIHMHQQPINDAHHHHLHHVLLANSWLLLLILAPITVALLVWLLVLLIRRRRRRRCQDEKRSSQVHKSHALVNQQDTTLFPLGNIGQLSLINDNNNNDNQKQRPAKSGDQLLLDSATTSSASSGSMSGELAANQTSKFQDHERMSAQCLARELSQWNRDFSRYHSLLDHLSSYLVQMTGQQIISCLVIFLVAILNILRARNLFSCNMIVFILIASKLMSLFTLTTFSIGKLLALLRLRAPTGTSSSLQLLIEQRLKASHKTPMSKQSYKSASNHHQTRAHDNLPPKLGIECISEESSLELELKSDSDSDPARKLHQDTATMSRLIRKEQAAAEHCRGASSALARPKAKSTSRRSSESHTQQQKLPSSNQLLRSAIKLRDEQKRRQSSCSLNWILLLLTSCSLALFCLYFRLIGSPVTMGPVPTNGLGEGDDLTSQRDATTSNLGPLKLNLTDWTISIYGGPSSGSSGSATTEASTRYESSTSSSANTNDSLTSDTRQLLQAASLSAQRFGQESSSRMRLLLDHYELQTFGQLLLDTQLQTNRFACSLASDNYAPLARSTMLAVYVVLVSCVLIMSVAIQRVGQRKLNQFQAAHQLNKQHSASASAAAAAAANLLFSSPPYVPSLFQQLPAQLLLLNSCQQSHNQQQLGRPSGGGLWPSFGSASRTQHNYESSATLSSHNSNSSSTRKRKLKASSQLLVSGLLRQSKRRRSNYSHLLKQNLRHHQSLGELMTRSQNINSAAGQQKLERDLMVCRSPSSLLPLQQQQQHHHQRKLALMQAAGKLRNSSSMSSLLMLGGSGGNGKHLKQQPHKSSANCDRKVLHNQTTTTTSSSQLTARQQQQRQQQQLFAARAERLRRLAASQPNNLHTSSSINSGRLAWLPLNSGANVAASLSQIAPRQVGTGSMGSGSGSGSCCCAKRGRSPRAICSVKAQVRRGKTFLMAYEDKKQQRARVQSAKPTGKLADCVSKSCRCCCASAASPSGSSSTESSSSSFAQATLLMKSPNRNSQNPAQTNLSTAVTNEQLELELSNLTGATTNTNTNTNNNSQPQALDQEHQQQQQHAINITSKPRASSPSTSAKNKTNQGQEQEQEQQEAAMNEQLQLQLQTPIEYEELKRDLRLTKAIILFAQLLNHGPILLLLACATLAPDGSISGHQSQRPPTAAGWTSIHDSALVWLMLVEALAWPILLCASDTQIAHTFRRSLRASASGGRANSAQQCAASSTLGSTAQTTLSTSSGQLERCVAGPIVSQHQAPTGRLAPPHQHSAAMSKRRHANCRQPPLGQLLGPSSTYPNFMFAFGGVSAGVAANWQKRTQTTSRQLNATTTAASSAPYCPRGAVGDAGPPKGQQVALAGELGLLTSTSTGHTSSKAAAAKNRGDLLLLSVSNATFRQQPDEQLYRLCGSRDSTPLALETERHRQRSTSNVLLSVGRRLCRLGGGVARRNRRQRRASRRHSSCGLVLSSGTNTTADLNTINSRHLRGQKRRHFGCGSKAADMSPNSSLSTLIRKFNHENYASVCKLYERQRQEEAEARAREAASGRLDSSSGQQKDDRDNNNNNSNSHQQQATSSRDTKKLHEIISIESCSESSLLKATGDICARRGGLSYELSLEPVEGAQVGEVGPLACEREAQQKGAANEENDPQTVPAVALNSPLRGSSQGEPQIASGQLEMDPSKATPIPGRVLEEASNKKGPKQQRKQEPPSLSSEQSNKTTATNNYLNRMQLQLQQFEDHDEQQSKWKWKPELCGSRASQSEAQQQPSINVFAGNSNAVAQPSARAEAEQLDGNSSCSKDHHLKLQLQLQHQMDNDELEQASLCSSVCCPLPPTGGGFDYATLRSVDDALSLVSVSSEFEYHDINNAFGAGSAPFAVAVATSAIKQPALVADQAPDKSATEARNQAPPTANQADTKANIGQLLPATPPGGGARPTAASKQLQDLRFPSFLATKTPPPPPPPETKPLNSSQSNAVAAQRVPPPTTSPNPASPARAAPGTVAQGAQTSANSLGTNSSTITKRSANGSGGGIIPKQSTPSGPMILFGEFNGSPGESSAGPNQRRAEPQRETGNVRARIMRMEQQQRDDQSSRQQHLASAPNLTRHQQQHSAGVSVAPATSTSMIPVLTSSSGLRNAQAASRKHQHNQSARPTAQRTGRL